MGNDLARRVRENTGAGGEVATREAGAPTLAQQIQNMQHQFALAMPRGAEAAQLVRDAITCLRTTRKLAECEPASVLGGLMTCAQLGLRPGVLGHAWLLPFWDSRLEWLDDKGRKRSGGYKAQLVIGYQGLIELAHRSGQIKSLVARTVHENDAFDVSYGIDDELTHKPVLRGDRGEPIAYYAVAKFVTGGHAFFVMGHDEMCQYRDRYAMARTKQGEIVGPWRDQFEGMALKTCIRQLAKWMPKSTEFASAIEADGSVRVDLTPEPDALLHGEKPAIEIRDDEPDTESEQDGPPVVDAPADEPPVQTAPAPTKTMMARLHALLADCKVTEPKRHATLGLLAGRPIGSANDLTRDEATKVIDALDRCAKSDDPPAALDYLLSAQDGTEGGSS